MYRVIATLTILFFSIQSYAQYTPADSNNGIMVTPEFLEVLKKDHRLNDQRVKAINEAGILLEKSGGQALGALVCVVAGTLLAVLGSTDEGSPTASQQGSVNVGYIAGAALGGVAIGLTISSHVQKKKAGTILRQIE